MKGCACEIYEFVNAFDTQKQTKNTPIENIKLITTPHLLIPKSAHLIGQRLFHVCKKKLDSKRRPAKKESAFCDDKLFNVAGL
jgi:hypothetical protein